MSSSQAAVNRLIKGDFQFDGLPYLTRDILVLSSTVQWFGTNVGWCFIETDISRDPGFHPEREFLIKFAKEMERKDMVAFLTHVCTPRCFHEALSWFIGGCYVDGETVFPRDRAVIDGLMRWLGRKAGRTFIADYTVRKENAWNAADNQRRQERIAS